jgi:NADH-quinone oxidoreductase subunit L
MTLPLMVLAVGAMVAGFVGVPAALFGNNAISTFLQPSFSPPAAVAHAAPEAGAGRGAPAEAAAAHEAGGAEAHHISEAAEVGLMAFSVAIGVLGIFLAYRFYVQHPDISEQLARRFAAAHRWLLNKYYVDEFYDATVVDGTVKSAHGLWTVDRKVVDGVVNGAGALTVVTSWLSGLTDRTVVDGVVNGLGRTVEEASFTFRRVQTGLVQNYALLMLFGVFAFVTIYLFAR